MKFSEIFAKTLEHDNRLAGFRMPSFIHVLELLDSNRQACLDHGHSNVSEEALNLMKYEILIAEQSQLTEVSRFEMWNVTVTMPKKEGDDFSYQFCSPPPHCTRIFFSYDKEGNAVLRIANPCVVLNPDLEAVHAYYGGGHGVLGEKQLDLSIGQTIRDLDATHIQRVGLLGFARNLPDHLEDSEIDAMGLEQLKTKLLYQQRASYAGSALKNALLQLEAQHIAFTTVNGGWAGQQQREREVGITFMGHLYGLLHDYRASNGVGGKFPPISVMPEGGTSDSVTMRARTDEFLAIEKPEDRKNSISSRTQFIVENVDWGEDSPYLASICTSMLVIEPAGRWTQIEMLNGLERGIPVVIVASPENYSTEWMPGNKIDPLYVGLSKGQKFIEIPFPTSINPKEKVRAYRDPADAAKWIAWRYEVDHFLDTESSTVLKEAAAQSRIKQNMATIKQPFFTKDQALTIEKTQQLIGSFLDGVECSEKTLAYLSQKGVGLNFQQTIQMLQSILLSPDFEAPNLDSMFYSDGSFFKRGTQADVIQLPVPVEHANSTGNEPC